MNLNDTSNRNIYFNHFLQVLRKPSVVLIKSPILLPAKMPRRTKKNATGESTRGATQTSAGSSGTQYSSDFSEADTLHDNDSLLGKHRSPNKRKLSEYDHLLAPTIEVEDIDLPEGTDIDNPAAPAITHPLPEGGNSVFRALGRARDAVSSTLQGKSKRQKSSKRLPSDPLPRKKVDVNKLDLHKSYAGLKKTQSAASTSQKNKKAKRKTWGPYDPPIEDLKLVPEGWSHQERDLDLE